ncbi:hypothetical protein [Methanoregula sp.]|uniref:hypothetical protein n=1 Tax=Methanoregula sp. TaxID=2052170 RepID=UPI003BAF43BC
MIELRKLSDKRVFEAELYKGLASRRESTVEHLVIHGSDQIPYGRLLEYFEKLCESLPRVKSKPVEFCLVLIRYQKCAIDGYQPSEHLHAAWAKPYMTWRSLGTVWKWVSNSDSHITTKTVRGSKSARSQMERFVGYLVTQDLHHECNAKDGHVEVVYYESAGWVADGYSSKIKKDKVSKRRGRGQGVCSSSSQSLIVDGSANIDGLCSS